MFDFSFIIPVYKDTTFPVSAVNKLYRKHCWDNLRFPKGKLCEDAFTTYLLVDQAKKLFRYQIYCITIAYGKAVL